MFWAINYVNITLFILDCILTKNGVYNVAPVTLKQDINIHNLGQRVLLNNEKYAIVKDFIACYLLNVVLGHIISFMRQFF